MVKIKVPSLNYNGFMLCMTMCMRARTAHHILVFFLAIDILVKCKACGLDLVRLSCFIWVV